MCKAQLLTSKNILRIPLCRRTAAEFTPRNDAGRGINFLAMTTKALLELYRHQRTDVVRGVRFFLNIQMFEFLERAAYCKAHVF